MPFAESDGASIAYEVRGSRGALLLLSAGNGKATAFDAVVPLLAQHFRVVTFDRRCRGRSTGDATQAMDLAQTARDLRCVVRAALQSTKSAHDQGAASDDRVIVFGTSGGAVSALSLAQECPGLVSTLVVHEPPVISLLPDHSSQMDQIVKIVECSRREGPHAGMDAFVQLALPFFWDGTPTPKPSEPDADTAYFLEQEIMAINSYAPDFELIRKNVTEKCIALVGDATGPDVFYARTVPLLAEKLQCDVAVVPGNHVGYLLPNTASAFGEALLKIIQT
ncbi:Alpha/Beta hydrolase protein [Chytriomyces sp. MP71]|nr:Alpha/Beta hydrolase protein [Chytriomyces sp. MP71]